MGRNVGNGYGIGKCYETANPYHDETTDSAKPHSDLFGACDKNVAGANVDIIRNIAPYTFQARIRDDSLNCDSDLIWKIIEEHKEAHMAYYQGYHIEGGVLNTNYSLKITYCTVFYPQSNLPRLRLDGTWRLDGTQQLSGYDGYGAIDLYPMHIRIQSGIRAALNGFMQVNFKYAAREEIGNASKVLIRAPTIGRPKIRESITVPMAFRQETAAGGITIRNENRLDGTWKLDGRRKLNGGSESR